LSGWNVSSVKNMGYMFAGASSFDQNLCVWGSQMPSNVDVGLMFWGSDCPSQIEPSLSSNPPGPFCHFCV